MMYTHVAVAEAAGQKNHRELGYDLAGESRSTEWHDTPNSTAGTERRWNGSKYVYRPKGGGKKSSGSAGTSPKKSRSGSPEVASGQAIVFSLESSNDKEIADVLQAAGEGRLDDEAVRGAAKAAGVKVAKTQAHTVARIVDKIRGTSHEKRVLAKQKVASAKEASKKAPEKKSSSKKVPAKKAIGSVPPVPKELDEVKSALKERAQQLDELQALVENLLANTPKR